MTVQDFGQQAAQLPTLGSVEAGEEFLLDGVGMLLKLSQAPSTDVGLVLGPVSTRGVPGEPGEPGRITSDQIGTVATALTPTPSFGGRTVGLHGSADADRVLGHISAAS